MGHPRSSTPVLYIKQLGALLWKGLIIRKVHFISTFFELVSPLLLIFVFAILYSNSFSGSPKHQNSEPNEPIQPSDSSANHEIHPYPFSKIYFDPLQDYSSSFTFLFAPNNTVTQKLVSTFSYTQKNRKQNVQVKSYSSEAELNEALRLETQKIGDWGTPYDHLIAVYFQNSEEKDVLKNGQLKYKIRMPGDERLLTATMNKFPLKIDQRPYPDNNLYMYKTFSKVQAYINRELVKETCSANGNNQNCSAIFENDKKHININQMPYPDYKKPSQSYFNILDLVALCIPISYVLVCPLIVKRITDEKATKAKELLRLIGMSDFVFYYAHFLNYMALILVHAILATIIVFAFPAPLYSASSPLIFFIGYLLWGAQLILFSHFVTTIFNR